METFLHVVGIVAIVVIVWDLSDGWTTSFTGIHRRTDTEESEGGEL